MKHDLGIRAIAEIKQKYNVDMYLSTYFKDLTEFLKNSSKRSELFFKLWEKLGQKYDFWTFSANYMIGQ